MRRSIDRTAVMARGRQARKAAADAAEKLPQTRDIDAALANAFADRIREKYDRRLTTLIDRSELAALVDATIRNLHASGFAVAHPLFRARLWTRLGDDSVRVTPRRHE